MAYVRIWVHLVFGTKNREPYLIKEARDQGIKHIMDNAKSKEIFIDSINGFNEHLHCLISLGREQSIAKVTNLIKGESSYWINRNEILRSKFEWADEYFAVSIGESQVDSVRLYIKTQEDHHRRKTFAEEYDEFIKEYGFRYLG